MARAYNAPPEGYNLDGSKKWTNHMLVIFANFAKGNLAAWKDQPEILADRLTKEVARIEKMYGYPKNISDGIECRYCGQANTKEDLYANNHKCFNCEAPMNV
jgi:hypothetical protein